MRLSHDLLLSLKENILAEETLHRETQECLRQVNVTENGVGAPAETYVIKVSGSFRLSDGNW